MVETISTKAGEYPVERKPNGWKETAGALEGQRRELKEVITLIESELNG